MVKVSVHACLPNGHLNLWSNFDSDKLVKSETSSCGFVMVGLKCGENSSKHDQSMIKFYFREISQK